MSLVLQTSKFLRLIKSIRCYHTDDGGHVRDMGGKWEERGKAFENEYINRKDRECLEQLKKKLEKRQKGRTDDEDKKQDDEKREESIVDDDY